MLSWRVHELGLRFPIRTSSTLLQRCSDHMEGQERQLGHNPRQQNMAEPYIFRSAHGQFFVLPHMLAGSFGFTTVSRQTPIKLKRISAIAAVRIQAALRLHLTDDMLEHSPRFHRGPAAPGSVHRPRPACRRKPQSNICPCGGSSIDA